MDVLAEIVQGRWRPGIGDPTPMGWVTVGAYLVTAVLCWRWGRSLSGAPSLAGDPRPVRFCYILAVVLLLLGVNKQLDLQTWFTQTGKTLAQAQGWYAQRRLVQVAFVASLAVAGLGLLALLFAWTRGHWRRLGPALVGFSLLAVFVAIRAASYHKVDRMIGWRFAGLKLNWIIELGSIGLIAFAALRGRSGTDA